MAKKCFTVGYQMAAAAYRRESNPYIRFGGAWLKGFGINAGDKLELIEGRNMIVLMKVHDAD